jgi:hypothetical protein
MFKDNKGFFNRAYAKGEGDSSKKSQGVPDRTKPIDMIKSTANSPKVNEAKSSQDKARQSAVESSSDANKNSETPTYFKRIEGNTELANAQRDQRQEKEGQESSSKRQLSCAEAGLMRLHKIYDTRPTHIEKHNYNTLAKFEERYTIIVDHSPITRSCHSYTYVKGNEGKIALYKSELDANGNFSVVGARKHWPVHTSESFDNEIKAGETRPLYHSQIMYYDLCYMQHFFKTKTGCSEVDLKSLKDSKIYNPNTRGMIDAYLKEGEREKTFSRGEPGYIATAGTDLGVGKWYLIKHHYKNKEIVAVTLQREIDKDGKDIYNIIYHIEDKS